MNKELFDERACTHTLGCLLQDPTLIDDINRPLDRSDFCGDRFFEILYIAIYNLVMQGVEVIDEFSIEGYLKDYKDQFKVWNDRKGYEKVGQYIEYAKLPNYEYYYHRMRKFSLLRYYDDNGLDITFIYNWKSEDIDGSEQIKFDEYTEQDIVDQVENVFSITPKLTYCSNSLTDNIQAGDGMLDMVYENMETPDFGYDLTSPGLNTVARGGRKGKFLFRSSSTGGGKTRSFIMDATHFAVPYKWDKKEKKFKYTGQCVPTLYIGTEGSNREFQSIILAAVSGVNEESILYGEYKDDELERIKQATKYIEESPLYIVYMDDFSISDIENITKQYVYTHQIEVMILDYLQSTLRLMTEISQRSSGLKEYQLLIIFSTRMKALAERLNIFIESGSQITVDKEEPKYYDQRVLQGSRAVANKIDVGIVQTKVTAKTQEKVKKAMKNMMGVKEPNILQWCYKCRSGRLSRIIICSYMDMGTMTIEDCFVTDFDFNLINIDFTKIELVNKAIKDNSKEMTDEDFESEKDEEEQPSKKYDFDW